MINVKDEVYAALLSVTDNVTDSYPKDWEKDLAIQYMEEDDRPQVALDVNYENGFGVSIGRLREDAYFDWKFVGLSHNTVRGAAGGALLMAELLKAKGYITAK